MKNGIKNVRLLRIPISILPEEEVEECVKKMMADGGKHQIVFVTFRDLMRARRNVEYNKVLNQASLVIPTSRGIVRIAKFLKKSLPIRYNPFEFIIKLLGILEKLSGSVYLLGSDITSMQKSDANLRASYPGLKIVGRCAGYYPRNMEDNIVLAIKKASPSLLLAGSGLKAREKWVFRKKMDLNNGIYLWSRDCYEIFSGKKKKISKTLFKSGLEHFPDFFKKPWLILRLFLYPYYALLLIIYRIRGL